MYKELVASLVLKIIYKMEFFSISTIIVAILCIVVFVIILKLYIHLATGWDRSPTCLVGKTAIVTGANTGIGFHTAQDFAKRGGRVILACRNVNKAEEARKKIVDATGNPNVIVKIVDFASLKSVRKFAAEINATEEKLDILVNNAGAAGFDHVFTEDGLNLVMQINHFGPFLLTMLLLELMKKSAPSRIVNVSSHMSYLAKLNIANLNAFPTGLFPVLQNYCDTKLCNILFTNELARKLKGTGVCVNALHPGFINTELATPFSFIYNVFFTIMGTMVYIKTEAGAQTSIYAAVSKDIDGISGEYFADCKKFWMPMSAKNEFLAKIVWEKSAEFVKLTQ